MKNTNYLVIMLSMLINGTVKTSGQPSSPGQTIPQKNHGSNRSKLFMQCTHLFPDFPSARGHGSIEKSEVEVPLAGWILDSAKPATLRGRTCVRVAQANDNSAHNPYSHKTGRFSFFFFEIEAQSFVVLVAPEVPNGGPPGGTSEIDGLNYRICGKLQLCGDLAIKSKNGPGKTRGESKRGFPRVEIFLPKRENILSALLERIFFLLFVGTKLLFLTCLRGSWPTPRPPPVRPCRPPWPWRAGSASGCAPERGSCSGSRTWRKLGKNWSNIDSFF